MNIYTRTGDNGTTSLFGGKRLLKSDLLIEAYGTIDELTSFLGLLFVHQKNNNDRKNITTIQKDLYLIMGYLAGAQVKLDSFPTHTTQLEEEIDLLEKKLPVVHRFILPQGSELSIYAHICRTICRRAERCIVKHYGRQSKKQNKISLIFTYFNRLSDYLYIKAREYSQKRGEEIVI